MKVLVLFNPVSGPKHVRMSQSALRKVLDKMGTDYQWEETTPDTNAMLDRCNARSFDRIVIIGGDGTVREVAQYLLENKLNIPIGIVAQGSCNMLASSLGIPLFQPRKALEIAISGIPKPIDVLSVNRKYFALIGAGQGYDSVFIRGATRILKRHMGPLAYAFSFLKTFFFYRNHIYSLVIDGERLRITGKTVLVLNTLSLAGVHLDKQISPSDGKLNIVVLRPRTLWEILWSGARVLLRHPVERIPALRSFTGRVVSVNQKNGKRIQMDGEVMKGKNLQVEVRPGALDVVC